MHAYVCIVLPSSCASLPSTQHKVKYEKGAMSIKAERVHAIHFILSLALVLKRRSVFEYLKKK
jgi:hypothetical protein